jgi:hypothetical protein
MQRLLRTDEKDEGEREWMCVKIFKARSAQGKQAKF